MRRRTGALVILVPGLAPAAALATGPVEALLRELAPVLGPVAQVRVEGRIERELDSGELVVSLLPEGGARLVADPGVQVVPFPGPDGHWAASGPVELVDPSRPYFEGPVELRVPIAPHAAGTAEAEVAYAWCVVERICLFGSTTLTVPLPEPDS